MLSAVLCLIGGLLIGAGIVLLVVSYYIGSFLKQLGFEFYNRR